MLRFIAGCASWECTLAAAHGESPTRRHSIPLPTAHLPTQLLKSLGWDFDVAYTSVLKRAVRTLWGILGEMGLEWLPVHRLWRLNERSYGALQGMNKAETAAQHGEAQVKVRRVCVLGGSRELRLLLSDGLLAFHGVRITDEADG